MRRFLPLLCLALVHTLVDAFAIVIEPLWPRVGQSFELGAAGIGWLMLMWAVTTSGSQVLFGYLRDRFGTPYILVLGPLMAVVAISAIGIAPSATILFAALLLGGLGIGAFHPEGAVTASSYHPENRTRTLSLFMFGGTMGLAIGPVVSGNLVFYWGLGSLVWLAAPAVALVLFLTWFSRSMALALAAEAPASAIADALPAGSRNVRVERNPSSNGCSVSPDQPHPTGASLKDVFHGKVGYTLLLLSVCATRVVPSVGMGRALAFVLYARGVGENVIGATQSVFLLAGGVGMLVTAALLRHGWERKAMQVCPIVGLPLVLLLAAPGVPYWLMLTLLVPTGLVLTGTTPAMVSYAHQLLPRGRGLASSITMGLCWGIGGAVVAGLVAWSDRLGSPSLIIAAFAPFLVVSAALAVFLPELTAGVELTEEAAATHEALVPARPNMAEVS